MKKLAFCLLFNLLASQSFAVCPPIKEKVSCSKKSFYDRHKKHALAIIPMGIGAALGFKYLVKFDRLNDPKYATAAGFGLGSAAYAAVYGLYKLFVNQTCEQAEGAKKEKSVSKHVHFQEDDEADKNPPKADDVEKKPTQEDLLEETQRASNEAQLRITLLDQVREGVKLNHVSEKEEPSEKEEGIRLYDRLVKEIKERRNKMKNTTKSVAEEK